MKLREQDTRAQDDRGLYIIWLRLDQPCRTRVGSLGDIQFKEGMYAYVGSAQRNRSARVRRHLKREKPLRWHIDYLRPHGKVVAVSYVNGMRRDECNLAERVRKKANAAIGYPRLGASDCRCAGHLLYLPSLPRLDMFKGSYETF